MLRYHVWWAVRSAGLELRGEVSSGEIWGKFELLLFFFSFLKKRALIDNINLFKRLLKMYVY